MSQGQRRYINHPPDTWMPWKSCWKIEHKLMIIWFSYLNNTTVSNPKVSGLLSKYNFTESDKFEKLYNASINFIRHWKSKMICEVNDVKKALNKSVFEANLTPTNMPEHDLPTTTLKDYFNTAIMTFFRFLRENGHSNPRDFKYIIEAHNNEDPNRTRQFTVSMVLQDWGQQTIKYVLERIERFIISSNLQNLKDLSLLLKCYPVISGGAINTSFNEAIYSKKTVLIEWLMMEMNVSGGDWQYYWTGTTLSIWSWKTLDIQTS